MEWILGFPLFALIFLYFTGEISSNILIKAGSYALCNFKGGLKIGTYLIWSMAVNTMCSHFSSDVEENRRRKKCTILYECEHNSMHCHELISFQSQYIHENRQMPGALRSSDTFFPVHNFASGSSVFSFFLVALCIFRISPAHIHTHIFTRTLVGTLQFFL